MRKVLKRKLFKNPKEFIFATRSCISVHDSQETQNYLEENSPNFLSKNDTPSKLDDFWPIENVSGVSWCKKVYKNGNQLKTKEQLKKKIFLEWSKIKPEMLRTMVHDMKFRAKKIFQLNGNKIVKKKDDIRCFCYSCVEYRKNK